MLRHTGAVTFGSAGQRGRWRLAKLQRDAERRKLEARHAMALARHRRGVGRARANVVRFTLGTVGSIVGAVLAAGFAELFWAVAAAGCALEAALWSRQFLVRRRSDPPTAPALPQAVPAPPPRSSAAWPALRRVETAVTAIRRLAPALPADLAEAAAPSVAAARAAYDMGRAQATQIAAAEAALLVVPAADRTSVEQVRARLLDELDLAAVAVERLLTSCTRLIGARSGYLPLHAQGQLSAATAEVVARTYGLAAAALTSAPPGTTATTP
jgi:hypothetical protein